MSVPTRSLCLSNPNPLTSLGLLHMVGWSLSNASADLYYLPSVAMVNVQCLNEPIMRGRGGECLF